MVCHGLQMVCLLWSVMVCKWCMRMVLGLFAANDLKGLPR